MDKRQFLVLIAIISFTVFLTANTYANTPPNATIENITGYENTNIIFNVPATDSDGDPVTYSSDNPKVRWNGTDLYYEADYDDVIHPDLIKTIAVNIIANDGLLTYTQEVNITLLDVNRAPYYENYPSNPLCNITRDWNQIEEDSGWTEDCINITEILKDPDGDSMSYEFYKFQIWPVIDTSMFSEQVCQYRIDENLMLDHYVTDNYFGYCYIRINATDSYGLSMINESGPSFWVNVTPSDDVPYFYIPQTIIYENSIAYIDVPQTDYDLEPMIYITDDTRFNWNGTHLLWDQPTYEEIQHPDLNINFLINVTGTDGKTNHSQIVDITLMDVNRAPYYENYPSNPLCNITRDWNQIEEDSGWTEDCINITEILKDPDGDSMSYEFYKFQIWPVIDTSMFSEQVCQYRIDENLMLDHYVTDNYFGYCYIRINATDSYGLSMINESGPSFWVNVTPINDAPVPNATIPTITFNEDEYNNTWNPANYFIDYESNPMFFSILNGINILADSITWNFTSNTPNWFGEENLTLTATDNMNYTTVNITVKVLPVNDRPVINQISDISANETEIIMMTPTATDVDDDLLIFSTNNSNLIWNTTADAFEWIPDYYDFGNHTINMTVSDTLLGDSAIFNIEVLRKRYGFSIDLKQGWNFISIPYLLDNTSVTSIMSPLSSDHIIWVYNSSTGTWHDYNSARPPNLNNLTDIRASQGFWIDISENEMLTIAGTRQPEIDIVLNKGWNMISYPLDIQKPVSDTLQAISGKYDIVWQYNASDTGNEWTLYNPLPEASPANTLHVFTSGYSYWINMTESADLTFSY